MNLRVKSVEASIADSVDEERSLKRSLGTWDLALMGIAVAAAAFAPTEKMPAPTATAMPMSARSQVPSERLRLRSTSPESAIDASTDFTRRFMGPPGRPMCPRRPGGAATPQRTTCIALAASVSEPESDG